MTPDTTILLVEDDHDVRALILRFLQGGSWQIHEADSTASALALVDTGIRFDLAILDFWLGAGNAIDVMDALGDIPKIIVSGGSARIDLEKTQAIADISGAVTFLQKPFSKKDLALCIEAALALS